MAFITGRTNRRLSNKAPVDYFPRIIEQRGEDALINQQIPMDRELWNVENYHAFLAQRRKMLADAINRFIEEAYTLGSIVETVVEGTSLL